MNDLKLRNLIAAREFNTACANRELAQFGQWTMDFAKRDAELADQIAAMLAEPVAAGMDLAKKPSGTTFTHWTMIEPLPGACVRVLPTPQGERRFLCLPEVELGPPAQQSGGYLVYWQWGWKTHEQTERHDWPYEAGEEVTAAFGPLPRVAP